MRKRNPMLERGKTPSKKEKIEKEWGEEMNAIL